MTAEKFRVDDQDDHQEVMEYIEQWVLGKYTGNKKQPDWQLTRYAQPKGNSLQITVRKNLVSLEPFNRG